jgi:acetylornithine deacetylase/succinyl-diaminopimelate desuccinylase-like protein
VDGRTRVRVHGEAKLGGPLRLAAGMARRQAEHQFRRDFERLKEVLERRDEESPSDRPPRPADE